jgi:hypothetical protein
VGQGHSMVQTDMIEKKIRDTILTRPLQTSGATPPPQAATTTATPLSLHSSYHGETADQLRHQSRPAPNWEPQRCASGTIAYGTPSSSRPMYPPTYSQGIQTPLPSFVPSPSSATFPPNPSGTSQQHTLLQSNSQEWTEYTSATTDSSQTAPVAMLSPSQGPSHKELDISEFDPIQS